MRRSISTIGVILVFAATAAAQVTPKVETFLGYTYTRANSATDVPAFSMNGGGGQVAVNFNKWVGFVMDMGAVHNGNINDRHIDTTVSNYLFGPRISLRYSRIRPYFQTLFGGAHLGTSTATNLVGGELPPTATQLPVFVPGLGDVPIGPGQPVTGRIMASQTAFGMAVGGGLDIKINRWVSFRPIGLDYYMTRFQNLRSLNDNNQHNIRYTTGFNFTFGGEHPAAPAPVITTKPCPGGITVPMEQECPKRNIELGLKTDQSSVCAGPTVTVSPATGLPADVTAQWSVNGEPAGQGGPFEFKTAGRSPGTYRIGLKATGEGYNEANAETTVTVRGYQPPTGTLQASPAEIWAGERSTLAPDFRSGECGGRLGAPELTASEGSISGNQYDSSSVRFDPASNAEQRKTITVAAKVSDERGSGAAQATIVVKKKATIVAKRLPDVIFPVGSARVNNCGKRLLLEELKALTNSDPAGKVVLVGHTTDSESKWPGLDEKRALNAAAVISAGQGICTSFPASQIAIAAAGTSQNGVDPQPNFCGTSVGAERPGQSVNEADDTAKYRRVEVWFVPSGGILPASVTASKDAASLSVSSLGCPR